MLAGWSAGMICWFEAGVTDSFGPQLEGMRDGLGFLPGSACPHYDGEDMRRPVYTRLVAEGFPPGVAADDTVALRYDGTELAEVVSRPADGSRLPRHARGRRADRARACSSERNVTSPASTRRRSPSTSIASSPERVIPTAFPEMPSTETAPPAQEVARAEAVEDRVDPALAPEVVLALEAREQQREERRALARRRRRRCAATPAPRARRGSSSSFWFTLMPDAEHDHAVAALGEHAGDLAPVEHHVVRPLDLRRQLERLLDGLCDREAADQRELASVRAGRGPQQDRAEDRASRRRLPRPAEPPAAAGLLVGHGHGSLGPGAVQQSLGRLAALLVQVRPPEPPRQERLDDLRFQRVGHTRSIRTAQTLYSGVPISGSPTSCVSQLTFACAKWSAIQTSPG